MDAAPLVGGLKANAYEDDGNNNADNNNKTLQRRFEVVHTFPGPLSSKSLAPSQSSSALSVSKYGFDIESALYNGGQSLASILNNPHVGKSGVYTSEASWGVWWPSTSANSAESIPLPVSKMFPEITRANFQPYVDSIFECYSRFEDVRQHSCREQSNQKASSPAKGSLEGESRRQGEALAACLREIPSLYFKEDFALEDGATFQAACPFSSIPQNVMLQEKLSHYLDIVEVHLVKEISVRSDSFFEAQGQLQDLNGQIVEACNQLRELKATVKLLDVDLVESARRIQDLSTNRMDLLALHQKLKFISYVNQALSALKLLVAAGDCAGALDVIDDLQHLLDGDELVGLHCFRHLGDQLATYLDAVNSILAADFVRAAIDDAKDLESSILTKFQAREKDHLTSAKVEESFDNYADKSRSATMRDKFLRTIYQGLVK